MCSCSTSTELASTFDIWELSTYHKYQHPSQFIIEAIANIVYLPTLQLELKNVLSGLHLKHAKCIVIQGLLNFHSRLQGEALREAIAS